MLDEGKFHFQTFKKHSAGQVKALKKLNQIAEL
jgi:hypothetical protein